MTWARSLAVALVLLVCQIQSSYSADPPTIAGPEYEFMLYDNESSMCFYASFKLNFKIAYYGYNVSNHSRIDAMSTEVHLPNSTEVKVTGGCGDEEIVLNLEWEGESQFQSSFEFVVKNSTWYLSSVMFSFSLENSTHFVNPIETGQQTYVTDLDKDNDSLFQRSFSRKEYIYCERCKMFNFTNCSDDRVGECIEPCIISDPTKNTTMCSQVEIMQSVMYPGDFDTNNPSRKLCIEDYIALQEMIVPIVVGGLLAILLVLIFVAYIIAYIRRKRKEGQYERLGENNNYN